LRGLQPGVTVEDVCAHTGFELLVHPEVYELEPPAATDLEILRELDAGTAAGGPGGSTSAAIAPRRTGD
jgi:hypothetical protein